MMNEVNNDRNANSYTSYNLELFTIFRSTMDAIEHYTQDIFAVSYVCKRDSCHAFLPTLDSASQNLSKFLFHSAQMNMVLVY